MTCLIDRILDRAGMKSHAPMLGTFGTLHAHFQEKKSSLKRLGKSSKLFIVITLIHTIKSQEIFPRRFRELFCLENQHTKKFPAQKHVTSFLLRPEFCLSSKSLQCFTYRPGQPNADSTKNVLLLKNPQFLPNHNETLLK